MNEKTYWLGFSVFSGVGPVKFSSLLSRFNTAKDAWNAPKSDLLPILGQALIPKFLDFRNSFSIANYEKELKEKKVQYLILTDKEYPKLLKETRKAPFVLYIKGKLDFNSPQNLKTIGIVGARKTTQYGREVTKLLTEQLVLSGLTVVSGMAFGVDAVAAQTAIENNAKTIAVLGSGVDVCHPITNKHLYDSIIKGNGAVVSEVPIGQNPSKGLFPARNRIIAGLALGVLVTEGAEDSGALITAQDAIEIGRPVFAVPGPINSQMSKGPYKLIAKGAKLVTSAEDILKELRIDKTRITQKQKIKGDSEIEQKIIDLIQNEALHFNEIVRRLNKNSAEVATTLSILEVKGIVESIEGSSFKLSN